MDPIININKITEENKKEKKLLGKKRKLVSYKLNSLTYNPLRAELNEIKSELNTNIKKIKTWTLLDENIIKGNYVENIKEDIIIEKANKYFSEYAILNGKSFKVKLNITEDSNGVLFKINETYLGYLYRNYLKIYKLNEDNTEYKIMQRLFLKGVNDFHILFPFIFNRDDISYFFFKKFTLKNCGKLIIYSILQKMDKKGRIARKAFTLNLKFPFMWFFQKNNNEIFFIIENDFIFDIHCVNLISRKVTGNYKIKLINTPRVNVAHYPDRMITDSIFGMAFGDLYYLFNTEHNCEIEVINKLDMIESLKIFNDGTLWTVEMKNCDFKIQGNKIKYFRKYYLRQYKLYKKTNELIKIGEIRLPYKYIKDIVQLKKNNVLIFGEKQRLNLYK